ncbi:hypothetical protein [Scytonema sp. PRP1]|uniref:hypothetical protein n=1 Tax=Scytonema sp. PRP1 TaxID=3120513 RepID=UPI002FD18A11
MLRIRGGGGAKRNQELREKLDPMVRARLDRIPYARKLQLLDANNVKLSFYATPARKKVEESCTNKLTEFEKSLINEAFLKLFPDAIIREL